MIRMLVAATLGYLISVSAFAADKITLQLSANELAVLSNALAQLDSRTVVVKDQRGMDEAKQIPSDFPEARLTIAHDDAVIINGIREYQTSVMGLDAAAAAKIAEKKLPYDLLTFTVDSLNLKVNPIAPSVLAELAPICPSCAGMDTPPAAAAPTAPVKP